MQSTVWLESGSSWTEASLALKLVSPVSNQGLSATYNLHNRKMRRKWTAPPTSREEWTRYTKLWPGSICCQVQLNIRGSNVIGEDDGNWTRLSSAAGNTHINWRCLAKLPMFHTFSCPSIVPTLPPAVSIFFPIQVICFLIDHQTYSSTLIPSVPPSPTQFPFLLVFTIPPVIF